MSRASDLAKEVNKVLGSDSVKLGSDPSLIVEYLSTGVLPFDFLLDGGLPRGRFTEIYGDYSTLKSYVALCAIAERQYAGQEVALIDTEHSFDPKWAERLGVDVGSLIYQAPESGELAVDVTEALVRGKIDLIVWDSVAATLPDSERQRREFEEKHQPARLAALMSRATRKITAANSRTAILWINQTRMSIGKMFGDPTVVPGGKALPFYASYRVSLRKAGRVTQDVKQWDGVKNVTVKETVAMKVKATVEKSKLNAPIRDVYLMFNLKTGLIDDVAFLISWGLENGHVHHEGRSWWVEGGEKIVGAEKFKEWLEGDTECLTELESKCRGTLAPHRTTDGNVRRKS